MTTFSILSWNIRLLYVRHTNHSHLCTGQLISPNCGQCSQRISGMSRYPRVSILDVHANLEVSAVQHGIESTEIRCASVITLWCYLSETTRAGQILDTHFLVVFNVILNRVCEKAVQLRGSNMEAELGSTSMDSRIRLS